MSFYKSKTGFAARAPKHRTFARKARPSKGFAASPAGKHRTLALNAFKLAKRARAAGKTKHSLRMATFGKRALALSRAEVRLFKKGKALQGRAFAAQRAARAYR